MNRLLIFLFIFGLSFFNATHPMGKRAFQFSKHVRRTVTPSYVRRSFANRSLENKYRFKKISPTLKTVKTPIISSVHSTPHTSLDLYPSLLKGTPNNKKSKYIWSSLIGAGLLASGGYGAYKYAKHYHRKWLFLTTLTIKRMVGLYTFEDPEIEASIECLKSPECIIEVLEKPNANEKHIEELITLSNLAGPYITFDDLKTIEFMASLTWASKEHLLPLFLNGFNEVEKDLLLNMPGEQMAQLIEAYLLRTHSLVKLILQDIEYLTLFPTKKRFWQTSDQTKANRLTSSLCFLFPKQHVENVFAMSWFGKQTQQYVPTISQENRLKAHHSYNWISRHTVALTKEVNALFDSRTIHNKEQLANYLAPYIVEYLKDINALDAITIFLKNGTLLLICPMTY